MKINSKVVKSKMKILIIFAAVFVTCQTSQSLKSVEELFEEYKKNYSREYENQAEHDLRFEAFKKNVEIIKEFQDSEEGTAEYGLDEFSDQYSDDRKRRPIRDTFESQLVNRKIFVSSSTWVRALPESIDWREKDVVTEVKDQGLCNNSWAFSAVATIESLYAIFYGELISFSEQQLTDCDPRDGHCNDNVISLPPAAFMAIKHMGGLLTEDEYPYVNETQICQLNATDNFTVGVKTYEIINNDETDMAQALVYIGPISVCFNSKYLKRYKKGIIDNKKCSGGRDIDYSATIVGYGIENDIPYWIIKNSWGPNWGEDGYVRMVRGKNMCGITALPTFPVLQYMNRSISSL